MTTPDPYTPTPGGRYHIGPDGKRVRVDDTNGLPPDAPAPEPAPAPAAAPKTATPKE